MSSTPSIQTNGSVRLNLSAWAVLLSIFLAVLTGIGFVIRLDAKVAMMMDQVHMNAVLTTDHLASAGHAVALERTASLVERIKKIEEQSRTMKP